MLLLYMADKWIINSGRHDHCVNAFFLKHVDILALLFFVGYIENGIFMFFLVLFQAVI